MFELTYIGHAGWIVQKSGFKAIFDPWLNPTGTFFNSWHQFPTNDHMLTNDLFSDLDFIYISHSHHDHFDKWTLNMVDRKTMFIIPNFRDKTLRNGLKDLGFKNIVELREKHKKTVKDVNIQLIIEDGFNDRDSAIILDDGKNKIINLNDCHPSFEKIKKYSKQTDLLLLQCSSAIWWPCVYDYNSQDLIEKCKTKRNNVLKRSLEYYKQVKPKYVVPNAGPPIFLNEKHKFWDETRQEDFNPFPLLDNINSYLNDAGAPSLFVMPGSKIILNKDKIKNLTNELEREEIYGNFLEYLSQMRKTKIQNKQLSEDLLPNNEDLSNLINKFSSLIKEIKKESKIFVYKINFPVKIKFTNHSEWILNFDLDYDNCFSRYTNQEFEYSFEFDPQIVNYLIHKQRIDFDEYFLSMRFKCSRKEDKFNEFLFTMFKNLDINSFKLSEAIYLSNNIGFENRSETFVANINGKKKQIQKFCPHKFVDLEKCGVLSGDTLTCPLHNWKFDLKTGKCLTSDKYSLTIQDI